VNLLPLENRMEETEMKKRTPQNDGKNGFSMFEIIVVLLLIGIVATFIVVRGSSKTSYDLASEAEILKGHLRYVQLRAMSDTESWGMSFSTTGYQLLKNKAPVTDSLPNESGPSHTLPSGVAITTGAGTAVHFNERGIPMGNGDAPLTAATEIVLSGGTATQTISITPETGFIP
jgi:prepilin-type N-terminal cleavage/methylation domain-containing protein